MPTANVVYVVGVTSQSRRLKSVSASVKLKMNAVRERVAQSYEFAVKVGSCNYRFFKGLYITERWKVETVTAGVYQNVSHYRILCCSPIMCHLRETCAV